MKEADINAVGLAKYSPYDYPPGSEVEHRMSHLYDYLAQAKNIIAKYAPPITVQVMLRSEDTISHVAYWLMLADWRFDESKGTQQASYRVNTGRFAVKRYIQRCYQLRHRDSMKIQFVDSTGGILPNEDGPVCYKDDLRKEDPIAILCKQECVDEVVHMIDKDDTLSDPEKYSIKYVCVGGFTQKETGEHLGVSKSSIGAYIKSGLEKLCRRKKDYAYLLDYIE